jgi:3-deoxy-D-manno-octulosonate 8-phosphate phosphatase (KDO 8-P phosphatase)
MNVLSLFKNIRLFVLDIDGVLTDGTLLLLNDGQMARSMNIKDGYALQLAIKKGYRILAISGGTSEAVKLRLEKLGITDVFIHVANKKEVLVRYTETHQISPQQVLYMGDDLPDMIPMQMAGLACCPSDAATEIRYIAHYVSPQKGGAGCVRDVIEKVLKLNGHWNDDSHITSQ